jgi:hypothetical protein
VFGRSIEAGGHWRWYKVGQGERQQHADGIRSQLSGHRKGRTLAYRPVRGRAGKPGVPARGGIHRASATILLIRFRCRLGSGRPTLRIVVATAARTAMALHAALTIVRRRRSVWRRRYRCGRSLFCTDQQRDEQHTCREQARQPAYLALLMFRLHSRRPSGSLESAGGRLLTNT